MSPICSKNRRTRVDAGLCQPPRLQKVLHRDGRAGGSDAQTGERAEHDACQPVEVADDVGEGADVEHLAQQLGDHVLALAGGVAHGPIQPSDGHVDDDERGRQERHFALQQPETGVDVAREGVEELVDDGHVVHGVSSVAASGASPASSKLSGRDRRQVGQRPVFVRPGLAGEEAPPEGFGGGPAGVFAHGLPVGRALRAQRLEPHGIGGQGGGQVFGLCCCWPHAVSSTASSETDRTGTHRMAASRQLL
jgi:hypothetical protein